MKIREGGCNMSDLILHEVEIKLSEVFQKQVHVHVSRTMGGGCINHASRLETTEGIFFLKWNASCAADMFAREAEGLNELAEAAGDQLRIPRIICSKDVDQTPGFIVLEFLKEGSSGNSDDEKLGRGLAHIHRFGGDYFGFQHDNYCGSTPQRNSHKNSWLEFFRDNRLQNIIKLIVKQRVLSVTDRHIYDRLLDRLPSLIPDMSTPSLIHGDLWSGNYLFTTTGPALIDPAAYYADREMEFAIVTMFGGFSIRFFSAYNEAFPLSSDWRERNRLYQLYHILNHYYLFGGSYGSQALSVAKSYL